MSGRGWWDGYRGIPYLDHGRDRSGCDCWGLVRLVYLEQFGVELPGYGAAYECSDLVDIDAILEGRTIGWSEVQDPRSGDVVLMAVRDRGVRCFHVGLVINPRRRQMLHVMTKTSVIVESWAAPAWARRVTGFWRYDARA